MLASIRIRSFALMAVLSAVSALLLSTPAEAGPASRAAAIRLVGDVQLSTRAQRSTGGVGGPDASRAELELIRERMEEESPASSGGRSPALTQYLPDATVDQTPTLHSGGRSWRALNHFDVRYSDGGNQFSGEPADMGMCAGRGYVMEMVNGAVQIYTETGAPKLKGTYGNAGGSTSLIYSGPKAFGLNEFFGQPVSFDRARYFSPGWNLDPNTFGPFLYDVVCYYDDGADLWIAVTAILGVDDRTGDFDGYSGLLVAVNKASPLDNWTVYEINTTNDGSGGTPDHNCVGGPCFGDYPQLGVDRNGVYITTNEFALFGDGFYGTQLYALRKSDLARKAKIPASAYIEDVYSDEVAFEAYTLQPVNALDSQRIANTMFFGMSFSPYADVATKDFSVFRLANTDELNLSPPTLSLSDLDEELVTTEKQYGSPNHALQRVPTSSASTPFLNYLNAGAFGVRYAQQASPIPLDAGSGKFYGAWLSGGYIFLTTGTAATGTGGATYSSSNGSWAAIPQRAAVAVFSVGASAGGVSDSTTDEEIIGVPGQNLVYPSVAVNPAGSGAIGATLVGPNWWPVAAYALFSTSGGGITVSAGSVTYSSTSLYGVGPNDGFTGTGDGGYRTRWGDYGAAAVDAQGDVWLAVQSIEQACSNSQFGATSSGVPRYTCNNTRSAYANWGSRIIEVDL